MGAERTEIAFVVPTKDRPDDLRRLLRSLAGQSRRPAEVIVVDGGDRPIRGILDDPAFAGLNLRYERCRPPSASRQRNRGLALVSPRIPLVGFIDDDTVLAPGALERMAEFWAAAGPDVGGAHFNRSNHPPVFGARMKKWPVLSALGIYSGRPGDVLPSGFQVIVGSMTETIFVRWLGSEASIWRREVFAEFRFDEWFEGYSYLEDLDFSYLVGARFRLAVVGGADYEHRPGSAGRGNGFQFGRREALNRIHFVRKHSELSPALCYAALALRLGISLVFAVRERSPYYLGRAAGASIGMAQSFLGIGRGRQR